MKRNSFLLIVFTFLLALIFLPVDEGFAHSTEQERIIITFKEHINEKLLNHKDIEVHHVFPNYNAAAITVTAEVKQQLDKHDTVKRIEADSVVTTNGQIIDWGFKEINAATTHQLGLTGKGVKVGIIDSGVDSTHPDLKVSGGISFVGSPTDYNDPNGHGTHVAGIIAARDNDIGVIGVVPDAELYAIKVIGNDGLGNHSDVVKGVEWAVSKGLDIINLSITTPEKSFIMEAALNDAYEAGLIIIGASGNNLRGFAGGAPVDVLYPARLPTVIAVGAVNNKNERTRFSYFGNSLEFVAPGENIMSTYISNQRYAASSGTSMAAPFVTGVAALYKEAYPMMSNQKIRTMMQTNVIDLGAPGKDSQFGYGLIQAPKSVKEVVFPDLRQNSWYEHAILSLYKEGIVSGYPDGNFHPNGNITRAEAITMIGRTLSIEGTRQPTLFNDVSAEHYASGYISRANEQGIVGGYPDGSFGPSHSIIRADTAVMLANAFNLTKVPTTPFHDVPEEKYYAEAIHILKGIGVTTGFPDGTYQPMKQMTRAEFAVLLSNAVQKSKASHIR